MNNLGALTSAQGRYAEAEGLYRQVLPRMRRARGEDHPDTILAMHNLASVCAKARKHDEADKLFQETLEKELRVLGENAPYTARTTYRYGCALALRGNRARALDTLKQAVKRGYRDAEEMAQNPELKSLRGDPAFAELLAELRKVAAK